MIALALVAAVAAGIAVLGGRGAFAVAAGVPVGLALSGALWSAGLLSFGATGPASDLVLLVAAGAALAGVNTVHPRGRRSEGEPAAEVNSVNPGPRRAPGWLWAAAGAAAVVVAALFVEHSIRYPEGGWDAVAIWNLRARALFGAPDRLRDVFSPDLGAQHPDYPLMLPGLIAHGWFALGTRTQLVPIAVAFLFAASGVAALAASVPDRRAGLAAALLLLGTPDFLLLAWNQYADLKVAVLLLVAVVLASQGRFAAAGLVAGLCAYTKNEGLLELAALLVAVILVHGRRAGARMLLGAALPLALLAFFKLRWAPPNDLVSQTHAADLLRRVPWRAGLVARGFAAQLVDFGTWGAALPVVVVAWIAGWKKTVSSLFAALSLAVIFCIYLVTPLNPLEHMRNSLDRLIFQLWPSIIYATAISFAATGAAAPRRPATDRA